jgi:hypothetical protein
VSDAALGLRVHSGWATLIGIAEPKGAPVCLLRRRIELVAGTSENARQPYHAAQGLDLAKAARLIEKVREAAEERGHDELRKAAQELASQGAKVRACGVVAGGSATRPELAKALASHPMVHAAEGVLFREVAIAASRRLRVPVAAIPEKELGGEAERSLELGQAAIETRLLSYKKVMGAPWRKDEQQATLAAWIALVAHARS